ncbi:MAG TPA: DMT family transporter [Clostridia bacterium]|nr:DMT family transporter [Clostridia bacterium]
MKISFEKEKKYTLFYVNLVLLQCLLWGISNPLAKMGLEVISPFYCLALRYLIAFSLFLLFFGKRILTKINKEYFIPCLIISIFTTISFNASIICLMYTSATNAGFLISTPILFTPLFSLIILKQRIDKKRLLPIISVTIGLYFLCNGNSGFSFGWGEALALLSSISGACMLTFSSKYLQDLDSLLVSTIQSGTTGLFTFILALIFEDFPGFTGIPPLGWGVILYLGACCTFLAYIFQNTALSHIPANYVALAFCSEPIFTAIASYFLLGETLTIKGFIGAILIMLSIITASVMPEEQAWKEKYQEG